MTRRPPSPHAAPRHVAAALPDALIAFDQAASGPRADIRSPRIS